MLNNFMQYSKAKENKNMKTSFDFGHQTRDSVQHHKPTRPDRPSTGDKNKSKAVPHKEDLRQKRVSESKMENNLSELYSLIKSDLDSIGKFENLYRLAEHVGKFFKHSKHCSRRSRKEI